MLKSVPHWLLQSLCGRIGAKPQVQAFSPLESSQSIQPSAAGTSVAQPDQNSNWSPWSQTPQTQADSAFGASKIAVLAF